MSDLIGQRLGQYEILALLGKGGMAVVYRARQTSIARDVAVKVIKPHLAETPDFTLRFQREAQAIASLSHPFILKVFDYGQEGEFAYLVMEFLRGGSLSDLIYKAPFSLKAVGRTLEQVAAALDYAHERGIIHRDLKPQNILLDEKGNAHLTDFGIAKMIGTNAVLTQSGAIMGTPAYMSPEQWQGKALDARSDLYALGVMLFEMLTGVLPFNGDTPFSLMNMHVNEPPPSLRQIRPTVPQSIQVIIEKALAKNPADRFSSAGELAAAYHSALSVRTSTTDAELERPTVRVAPGVEAKFAPTTTQHGRMTLLLGLGGAVLLALVIGMIALIPNWRAGTSAPTAIPVLLQATIATEVLQVLPPSPSATSAAILPSVTWTSTPALTSTGMPTTTPTTTIVPPTQTLIPTAISVPTIFTSIPATQAPISSTSSPTIPMVTLSTMSPPTLSTILSPIVTCSAITANNAEQVKELDVLQTSSSAVGGVGFSPDGTLLASGGRDGNVEVWNVESRQQKIILHGTGDAISGIAFSPDNTTLAAGVTGGIIRLWDINNGKVQTDLLGHTNAVSSVVFSADGILLASASVDTTVRLWEVKTGQQKTILQGHPQAVSSVAFSPDGILLASVDNQDTVRLWDVKTGRQKAELRANTSRVVNASFDSRQNFTLEGAVVFSPDGTFLAWSGNSKIVHLWNIQTNSGIILEGHTDYVATLAFSSDSTLLVSAGDDKTVRLWNVKRGKQQAKLGGHTESVWGVGFSPNGTLLASGSSDHTVRVWGISTADRNCANGKHPRPRE